MMTTERSLFVDRARRRGDSVHDGVKSSDAVGGGVKWKRVHRHKEQEAQDQEGQELMLIAQLGWKGRRRRRLKQWQRWWKEEAAEEEDNPREADDVFQVVDNLYSVNYNRCVDHGYSLCLVHIILCLAFIGSVVSLNSPSLTTPASQSTDRQWPPGPSSAESASSGAKDAIQTTPSSASSPSFFPSSDPPSLRPVPPAEPLFFSDYKEGGPRQDVHHTRHLSVERKKEIAQKDMECRLDPNINVTLYPWTCDFRTAEETLRSACPAPSSMDLWLTATTSRWRPSTPTGGTISYPIKNGGGRMVREDTCRKCTGRPTTNQDTANLNNLLSLTSVQSNNLLPQSLPLPSAPSTTTTKLRTSSQEHQILNPSPFLLPYSPFSPFPVPSSGSTSRRKGSKSGSFEQLKNQLRNEQQGPDVKRGSLDGQCLVIRSEPKNLDLVAAEVCSNKTWIERRSPFDTRIDEAEMLIELLSKYHLNFCSMYTLNLLTTMGNFNEDEQHQIQTMGKKKNVNETNCYKNLRSILEKLVERDETAFKLSCEFNSLVSRYNCQSGFSVKWNCDECTRTYQEWVCSMVLPYVGKELDRGSPSNGMDGRGGGGVVREVIRKPCKELCERVEQRCPYFHPSHKEQYAGEPAFLCIDPSIPFINWILGSKEKVPFGNADQCYDICDFETTPKYRCLDSKCAKDSVSNVMTKEMGNKLLDEEGEDESSDYQDLIGIPSPPSSLSLSQDQKKLINGEERMMSDDSNQGMNETDANLTSNQDDDKKRSTEDKIMITIADGKKDEATILKRAEGADKTSINEIQTVNEKVDGNGNVDGDKKHEQKQFIQDNNNHDHHPINRLTPSTLPPTFKLLSSTPSVGNNINSYSSSRTSLSPSINVSTTSTNIINSEEEDNNPGKSRNNYDLKITAPKLVPMLINDEEEDDDDVESVDGDQFMTNGNVQDGRHVHHHHRVHRNLVDSDSDDLELDEFEMSSQTTEPSSSTPSRFTQILISDPLISGSNVDKTSDKTNNNPSSSESSSSASSSPLTTPASSLSSSPSRLSDSIGKGNDEKSRNERRS